MKIKMLTSMSGPTMQRNRGDEIDVPDAEAKRLVEAGFAAPAIERKGETAVKAPAPEKRG